MQQVCLTPNGMNMTIQQPNEIPIRRNYLPALKVEYSSSAHQKSFRIQIYRIQVSHVKKQLSFILKDQLLWKLGFISRIVWIFHVFNLIVIIGFYISASQSLKLLFKCFLEKKEEKKNGIHLPCIFLEHFCITSKKR